LDHPDQRIGDRFLGGEGIPQARSGQSVNDPRAFAEEVVDPLRMPVPHHLRQSDELIDAVQVILHRRDRTRAPSVPQIPGRWIDST